MSDPMTQAKTARESLARGLSALQAPGLPDALNGVAEQVAMAMSALHHIEASHGAATAENAPSALSAVRQALSLLQTQAGAHPAVDQATEAVAGALGLVHSLNQAPAAYPNLGGTAVMQPSPVQAPVPQYAAPQQAAPAPQYAAPQQAAPAPQYAQAQGYPQPAQPYAQPQAPAQPYAPQPAEGYGQPPAAAPWAAQPQPQAAPVPQAGWQQPQQAWPAPEPQPAHAPSHPHAAAAPLGSQPMAAPGPAVPIQAPPGAKRAEANLGAHSPSNFYKGLSGNDVIDSGGIFVSTYQMPSLGETVVIHITLPGGYEFEALGIVEWMREAPHSTADGVEAPPGFGAKFTQISPEGRQLVYRYVRNREPLFHDDL